MQMENVTGDSEYSMNLHKLLDHYDVVVMTPRILENHVTGEDPLIPGGLAAFSLLVFDECHHTRKGEAYNSLMLSYLHTKMKSSVDLPQVYITIDSIISIVFMVFVSFTFGTLSTYCPYMHTFCNLNNFKI